jgi:hypothetical protein
MRRPEVMAKNAGRQAAQDSTTDENEPHYHSGRIVWGFFTQRAQIVVC